MHNVISMMIMLMVSSAVYSMDPQKLWCAALNGKSYAEWVNATVLLPVIADQTRTKTPSNIVQDSNELIAKKERDEASL